MDKNKEFLLNLERERHDSTWRTAVPPIRYAPTQPIIVKQVIKAAPKETTKQRHQRDQDFFDAGRFKEGARDARAVAAWAKMTRGKNNG